MAGFNAGLAAGRMGGLGSQPLGAPAASGMMASNMGLNGSGALGSEMSGGSGVMGSYAAQGPLQSNTPKPDLSQGGSLQNTARWNPLTEGEADPQAVMSKGGGMDVQNSIRKASYVETSPGGRMNRDLARSQNNGVGGMLGSIFGAF